MQLVLETRKVNLAHLQQLALKCLEHVQYLYASNWDTLIEQTYRPQIETIMLAKAMDEWEAAVFLYNNAKDPNQAKQFTDKIFFMAAVKIISEEKINKILI